MLTRQTGHFFFEPSGYDAVNDVSNAYKEAVKVGYNQTRKIILLLVWGSAPLALYVFPTLFGLFDPPATRLDFIRHVGALWLAIGVGGGLARMIQLFVARDVTTGLVWVFKVLTDPFHNIGTVLDIPAQAGARRAHRQRDCGCGLGGGGRRRSCASDLTDARSAGISRNARLTSPALRL
ncbi:hypothetical protein BRDID11002_43590 [Bradyrhizobium diazoefficiens]